MSAVAQGLYRLYNIGVSAPSTAPLSTIRRYQSENMTKKPGGHSIPLIRGPGQLTERPLYVRLYRRIRDGVLRGAIPPGTRLPSARTLAREEGISRNTVEAAYSQLRAEGFLVRRIGAGTWVHDDLPKHLLRPSGSRGDGAGSRVWSSGAEPPALTDLSLRGRRLAGLGREAPLSPGMTFAPCVPESEAIPLDGWNRIAARRIRRVRSASLVAPPSAGLPALCEAVATYLHLERGVRCVPEQVVIVNSTQQAMDLIARLLLDPDDAVWVEDPGYIPARRAFAAGGARLVSIPVDDEGIDVDYGVSIAAEARLACVTPSHQYPLGVTLSLARRLALLEWAEAAGSWIVEDDYDSELRYDGRPLAAMQGIDERGRVLYVGTFNKILFPGVRVAYLVLPEHLVGPFSQVKEITDGFTSPLVQGVLAEFIAEGHFAAHLRKVRDLYRERRDSFVALAREHLSGEAQLGPANAGMHLALHLPTHVDDEELSRRASARRLALPALSAHAINRPACGLVIHYGNAPITEMERAVREIERILADARVHGGNEYRARWKLEGLPIKSPGLQVPRG